MQFARAVRGIASACLVSILAACGGGGGGGDGDSYPANDTVVVNTATTATPATTYKIDRTIGSTGTYVVSGGRVVETASTQTSDFEIEVSFFQGDSSKYVIFFDDDSGDYGCRSGNLSSSEFQELITDPIPDAPVCSGDVKIDAGAHRLRGSKVTIPNLDTPSNKVVLSANVSWTL